jgi:hypothetical protein
MNLISTSWSCVRCGAAYISTPPDHGLCGQCLADLQALARLTPVAAHPCPVCGGPVCADCGTALIVLLPAGTSTPQHAGEVNRDGG